MKDSNFPTRITGLSSVVAVSLMGLVYSSAAFATTTTTTTTITTTTTLPIRNIIVIMADDMEMNDLPFFYNEPIQWDHENDPMPGALENLPPLESGEHPQIGEAKRRVPGLNRLAARLLAVPVTTTVPDAPDKAKLGPYHNWEDQSRVVVPIDLDYTGTVGGASPLTTVSETPGSFRYTLPLVDQGCAKKVRSEWEAACRPAQDILRGFGGLAKLAGPNAVVFRRFYSTSAVCAPGRTGFMTGRYHKRQNAGDGGPVYKFNSGLSGRSVTIAEFLKQGCVVDVEDGVEVEERRCWDWEDASGFEDCACYLSDTDDCASAPCYTTGFIGKWNHGNSRKAPWRQGFDEFIGFLGSGRPYWKTGRLKCSPDTNRYCEAGDQQNEVCLNDKDCKDSNGDLHTCSDDPGLALPDPKGLYIGPDPDHKNTTCTDTEPENAELRVECCEPNEKKVEKSFYEVHKKEVYIDGESTGDLFFVKDTKNNWPCSDDDRVDKTGCVYSTRMMRDHARDFIARHADEHFFLVVEFRAIHSVPTSPKRTEAHYKTETGQREVNKLRREFKLNYLAMIEELDAAIGGILKEVDKQGIAGKTVVFFTADQGMNREYGNPNLHGGKFNVYEGGIQVGLLARGPADVFGNENVFVVPDDHMGSMVDLFPTIAHVTHYPVYEDLIESTDGGVGRLPVLSVCWNTGERCELGTATCGGSGEYCGVHIDGVSLLKAMQNNVTTPPRDYSYAEFYKRAGSTVVTRKGYFEELCDINGNGITDLELQNCSYAGRVCGYDSVVEEGTCSGDGITSCTVDADPDECAPSNGTCVVARMVRHVRAASWVPCESDDQCDGKTCWVLGNVCATDIHWNENCKATLYDPQAVPDPDCKIDELPRCLKDGD